MVRFERARFPWAERRRITKFGFRDDVQQQQSGRHSFYEALSQKFPTVKSLASAELEDVFEQWAGLGYYSRARNLHKGSLLLAKNFPHLIRNVEYQGLVLNRPLCGEPGFW